MVSTEERSIYETYDYEPEPTKLMKWGKTSNNTDVDHNSTCSILKRTYNGRLAKTVAFHENNFH